MKKDGKMNNKRNCFRYKLWDPGKIVQFGITNDPERRKEEHKDEGKRFSTFSIEGPAVTKNSAEEWEEQKLKSYRAHHYGKNPRYNKTEK